MRSSLTPRARQHRLMRSLGFKVIYDPKRHILKPDQGTYWEHPTGVLILLGVNTDYSPDKVINLILNVAARQTINGLEDTVGQVFSRTRNKLEEGRANE